VAPPSSRTLRRRLVDRLAADGAVETDAVRQAFLDVPRELFVAEFAQREGLEAVYRDDAIPTKWGEGRFPLNSSSQPTIMARMLERLALAPGLRVLEVGAGTGYNAALLSRIVGPAGNVTTIDVDPALARGARAALRAAGCRARVVVGDGTEGHAAGAPYDRIVVTASAETIPRVWCAQLVEGGLVEVPLQLTANGGQLVVTFRREGDALRSVAAARGGFMPLRDADGNRTGPRVQPFLSAHDGAGSRRQPLIQLSGTSLATLPAAARKRLLRTALADGRRRPLGLRADTEALHLYLSLTLPASRAVAVYPGATVGLIARDGWSLAYVEPRRLDRVTMVARLVAHGERGAEDELLAAVRRWDERGRPGPEELAITVTFGGDGPRLTHRWRRPQGPVRHRAG
jgi:protein-L-isoaspartate(D-aspartate) O-methyltransferase